MKYFATESYAGTDGKEYPAEVRHQFDGRGNSRVVCSCVHYADAVMIARALEIAEHVEGLR